MFIIIFSSPPLIGFVSSVSPPDSFLYSYMKNKTIHVVKTRTLHVPDNIDEVVGNLQEFEYTKSTGCKKYGNNTILLINSNKLGNFLKAGCDLTGVEAAIIRIDDDWRKRSSAPVSTFITFPFPIVLMHDKDEEQLHDKDEKQFGKKREVSIVFNKDEIKFKVPCEDNCVR